MRTSTEGGRDLPKVPQEVAAVRLEMDALSPHFCSVVQWAGLNPKGHCECSRGATGGEWKGKSEPRARPGDGHHQSYLGVSFGPAQ